MGSNPEDTMQNVPPDHTVLLQINEDCKADQWWDEMFDVSELCPPDARPLIEQVVDEVLVTQDVADQFQEWAESVEGWEQHDYCTPIMIRFYWHEVRTYLLTSTYVLGSGRPNAKALDAAAGKVVEGLTDDAWLLSTTRQCIEAGPAMTLVQILTVRASTECDPDCYRALFQEALEKIGAEVASRLDVATAVHAVSVGDAERLVDEDMMGPLP